LPKTYQDVRSDKTETNWLLIAIDGTTANLKGSGTGGLEELKSSLSEDQVLFGYLRVTSGDAESKRAKFVFISWCGDKVGALKRAKTSVQKADIKKVIKDFTIEFHAETMDEVDETEIMNRVRKAGGADYSGNLANK